MDEKIHAVVLGPVQLVEVFRDAVIDQCVLLARLQVDDGQRACGAVGMSAYLGKCLAPKLGRQRAVIDDANQATKFLSAHVPPDFSCGSCDGCQIESVPQAGAWCCSCDRQDRHKMAD